VAAEIAKKTQPRFGDIRIWTVTPQSVGV